MGKKDYAISIVRLISLCLIIACHICQFYKNELAWWLNVGVQVFLLVSGYLYGQRDSIETKSFYRRNISKILVDYYLFLLICVNIYLIAFTYPIQKIDYLRLLFGIGTGIQGLGHLWYISTIIVCYVITPFIIRLLKPRMKRVSLLIILCSVEVVFAIIPGFTGAWINCYIIGMTIGAKYGICEEPTELLKNTSIIAFIASVLVCGCEVYIKYIKSMALNGVISQIANTFFHYGHIALGCTIFSGILFIARKTNIRFGVLTRSIFDITDRYSYDAFIVHLPCILGPCSFFNGRETSTEIIAGILMTISYIIVGSIFLNFLSSKVKRIMGL